MYSALDKCTLKILTPYEKPVLGMGLPVKVRIQSNSLI